MKRNKSAGWLLLLCTLVSGCSFAQASVMQPTPTPTAAVNDALRQDAEMMAESMDISVEEALKRMSQEQMLGTLGAQLEQQEAETFAGLWIQHEPEYAVIAAFTRDGQETLRAYVENTSLEEMIEVRTAEVSLAELKAIQQEVMQTTQELGFPFSSAIMVQKNLVELYVTDQDAWEAALQREGLSLPKHVKVTTTYEPLGTPPFELTPVSGLFMPQLQVQSSAFMDALLQGELVAEDGCLRVKGAEGDGHLVIWQPDYFLSDNGGQIEVLNRDGQVVARVGQVIGLGGGEVPAGSFESQLREPIPGQCQGPYWLMGDVVAGQ